MNEKTLILNVKRAVEEYCAEVNFGLSGMFQHGNVGKTRADNLTYILANDKVWNEAMQIWPILYCVFQTNSKALKSIITQRIVYCSSLSEKMYLPMKEMAKRMSYVDAQEACLIRIIEDNLPQPIDDRITILTDYLNGNNHYSNISALVETLHQPTRALKPENLTGQGKPLEKTIEKP